MLCNCCASVARVAAVWVPVAPCARNGLHLIEKLHRRFERLFAGIYLALDTDQVGGDLLRCGQRCARLQQIGNLIRKIGDLLHFNAARNLQLIAIQLIVDAIEIVDELLIARVETGDHDCLR